MAAPGYYLPTSRRVRIPHAAILSARAGRRRYIPRILCISDSNLLSGFEPKPKCFPII